MKREPFILKIGGPLAMIAITATIVAVLCSQEIVIVGSHFEG